MLILLLLEDELVLDDDVGLKKLSDRSLGTWELPVDGSIKALWSERRTQTTAKIAKKGCFDWFFLAARDLTMNVPDFTTKSDR